MSFHILGVEVFTPPDFHIAQSQDNQNVVLELICVTANSNILLLSAFSLILHIQGAAQLFRYSIQRILTKFLRT